MRDTHFRSWDKKEEEEEAKNPWRLYIKLSSGWRSWATNNNNNNSFVRKEEQEDRKVVCILPEPLMTWKKGAWTPLPKTPKPFLLLLLLVYLLQKERKKERVREEGEEEETSTALNPLLKTLQETRIPYFFLSFLPSFPQSGHQSLLPLLTLHHITRKNPCRNWAVIDSFLEPRDEGTYSQPCWVPHTHQNLDTKHGREHTHTHSLSLSLSLSLGRQMARASTFMLQLLLLLQSLPSILPHLEVWVPLKQTYDKGRWDLCGSQMAPSCSILQICVCFFFGVCVCVCVCVSFVCLC